MSESIDKEDLLKLIEEQKNNYQKEYNKGSNIRDWSYANGKIFALDNLLSKLK